MTAKSYPPFAYFGGKTRLAPTIAGLLPEHRHYVEPFAGSLAVLLAKKRSAHETVNDIDGDLVTFWRVLRNRPEDLARVCRLTPHSRDELAQAAYPACDELEQARRVWVRLTQGRAQTTRGAAWRATKNGADGQSIPDRLASYASRIEAAAERLRGVSIENRDALDVFADYGQHPDVLIYADPPYLASALSRASRGVKRYVVGMPSEDEHRSLAEIASNCRAHVVISGYDSPLYDELFEGWHTFRMRASAGNAKTAHKRVETVWSNRPLAGARPWDELASATTKGGTG